jgi:hypothetical protein
LCRLIFFCLIANNAIVNDKKVKLLSIALSNGKKEKSYCFKTSMAGKKKAIAISALIMVVSIQINGL